MLCSLTRLIFKTSSVTPDFFYVFNIILSVSNCSQSFKKICAWELLGANVLKWTQTTHLALGTQSTSQNYLQLHHRFHHQTIKNEVRMESINCCFTEGGIVSTLSSVKNSSGQDPSVAQNGDRASVLASLVEPFKANFL